MPNTLKLITAFILTLTISGCVFTTEPYREIKHHDLGIPDVQNPKGPEVGVVKFQIDGPYLYKMVFRSDDNELKIDEYNRWAQVPDKMLTRYLKMAFSGNSKSKSSKSFTITGTVLAFEGDKNAENAILTVECMIRENQGKLRKISFTETYLEKMAPPCPSKLAPAMSANSAKFANRVMEEVNKMK